MNIESVRQFCMSLPHATENVQWGDNLCFKIAGRRLFCITSLEPDDLVCSFKCTPENFLELQEVEGIVPAPYMASAHWVSLERFNVLRDAELQELLAMSYKLNYEKLTRKLRAELEGTAPGKKAQKTAAGTKVRKANKRNASARVK